MRVQVVWFKRDLRVHDHAALTLAARRGPVLPLYVIEPEQWLQPDSAARHWRFVAESLDELHRDLCHLGQGLLVKRGDILEVIDNIHKTIGIAQLWSHEETGNDWSYRRDRRVAAWCRSQAISWQEMQNHGVIRRLSSRNGWAKAWDKQMAAPQNAPPALPHVLNSDVILPSARDLGLAEDMCRERQIGGRTNGQALLQSFLAERGKTYRSAMSSPGAGSVACSRISPHLSHGTLAMREVAQAAWARSSALALDGSPGWRGALRSFTGRLHWHCHFMQKLEDAPPIEYRNLHRAYDGLRPSEPDSARLEAWAKGETGLPFVDACMRSLRATGWLNFRMRAMVMSVAAYHLWLDWRAPGMVLAKLFTDYEPGIHWSQVQMQSGTTGINTIRIYNPIKQGQDQDPTGAFTRRWLPELHAIPDHMLQTPWCAENAGQVLGQIYPHPIVDPKEAARAARERIWAVRNTDTFRDDAHKIQARHGSRKSGISNRGKGRGRKKQSASGQLELPF